MSYKRIVITDFGGPEVLKMIEEATVCRNEAKIAEIKPPRDPVEKITKKNIKIVPKINI